MNRKEQFQKLGTDLGALVGEKDEHYGEMMRSTALFLLSIFPDGISVDQYDVVGLLVRIFDKQKRSTHGGHDKAEDFRDIGGYGLQGLNHYTDPIHQRMVEDSRIEAERMETHGNARKRTSSLWRGLKKEKRTFACQLLIVAVSALLPE